MMLNFQADKFVQCYANQTSSIAAWFSSSAGIVRDWAASLSAVYALAPHVGYNRCCATLPITTARRRPIIGPLDDFRSPTPLNQ